MQILTIAHTVANSRIGTGTGFLCEILSNCSFISSKLVNDTIYSNQSFAREKWCDIFSALFWHA